MYTSNICILTVYIYIYVSIYLYITVPGWVDLLYRSVNHKPFMRCLNNLSEEPLFNFVNHLCYFYLYYVDFPPTFMISTFLVSLDLLCCSFSNFFSWMLCSFFFFSFFLTSFPVKFPFKGCLPCFPAMLMAISIVLPF